MFTLSLNENRVHQHDIFEIIPNGHQIAGVAFHRGKVVVTFDQASKFLLTQSNLGSWTCSPARFVMENAKYGLLRLTKRGEYTSIGDEYPVVAIYSIDVAGNVPTTTIIDGKHNTNIEIADFIRKLEPSLKRQMDRYILNEGIYKEIKTQVFQMVDLNGDESEGTLVAVFVANSQAYEPARITSIHEGFVTVELTQNRGSVQQLMEKVKRIKK